ncbi:hypothetical protein ACIQU5_32035 [Streptomyces sp. NPDC090306]|uniref:hypothetical protein n=1 Tax=Streptomyces sp. NPDC090306 TaxID=3365961 RepID=UPI003803543A
MSSIIYGRGTWGSKGRPQQGAQVATALSTVSGGAIAATISKQQLTIRVAAGLTVAVGDVLLVIRAGSDWVATDKLQAAPTVAPTPAPVIDTPVKDTGDAPPPSKPVTRTGTLVCTPTATACYRGSSWRSDGGSVNSFDTFQGRYSGSSYGRMTGCAFYGSKPHTLSGATITKATLKLKRLSAGDYAARRPTMRLISQTSRPSGAPTLQDSTTGPSLSLGGSTTWVVPTSWGQALADGSSGGLGLYVAADSPYICLAGRSSWSAAWTLTLSWRRTS